MDLTKEQFLARCANAFDAGLASESRLRLLDRWLDYVMRLEGGQMAYIADFLALEKKRTSGFHNTLAGDADGYALIQFSAILNHHCQSCAVDPKAWWTRGAFCEHRDEAQAKQVK